MNLFANPPDPVLAIQDILKAVSVKAVSFRCFDDADLTEHPLNFCIAVRQTQHSDDT